MDAKFLEWVGRTMMEFARQGQALSHLTNLLTGSHFPGQDTLWAGLNPPYSPEVMTGYYRDWLRLIGAVPKSDYDALAAKVQTLELEGQQLRASLLTLKPIVESVASGPEAFKTVAETSLNLTKDWLNFFNQLMGTPETKTPELSRPDPKTPKD